MHGNKHLSCLPVASVCKQWNVMYDGNSLQIHFIAKDDSNCSSLYRLQLVSLFCCDTWMPNSTRILWCHWADNSLIIIHRMTVALATHTDLQQRYKSLHCSGIISYLLAMHRWAYVNGNAENAEHEITGKKNATQYSGGGKCKTRKRGTIFQKNENAGRIK